MKAGAGQTAEENLFLILIGIWGRREALAEPQTDGCQGTWGAPAPPPLPQRTLGKNGQQAGATLCNISLKNTVELPWSKENCPVVIRIHELQQASDPKLLTC